MDTDEDEGRESQGALSLPGSFAHNILFLHTENPRVGRTRSGSLVPENSPMLHSNSNSPTTGKKRSNGGKGGELGAEKGGVTSGGGDKAVEVVVQISEMENLAFLLISFGYMVPWTSLGSLISYFKHTYNAEFYNKLYCAYYLPGLPVAFLQHKFDGYVDLHLGSRNAYMLRGVVSFIVMTSILVLMVWWREQDTLIFLFMVLGIFSWLCHGTASMLASMYPAMAIAYLQTGFRCPEIYTIAIVAALNIGSHPSDRDLDLFFCVTALIVALSLVVWIMVAGSAASRRFFDLKDQRMRQLHLGTDTLDPNDDFNHRPEQDREREPLLEGDRQNTSLDGSNNGRAAANAALGYSSTATAALSVDVEDAADDDMLSDGTGAATEISRIRNASSSGNNSNSNSSSSPSRSRMGVRDRKGASSAGRLSQHSGALRIRTKQVLRAVEDASMRNTVYRKVFSLCLALFITIWCSIFQASFFAYCDSPQGRDIEQILYFVRLFSDLLGRPLTRFTRPWFLQENNHVLNASIVRTLLMVVFFAYIFIPSFPRCASLPRGPPRPAFSYVPTAFLSSHLISSHLISSLLLTPTAPLPGLIFSSAST